MNYLCDEEFTPDGPSLRQLCLCHKRTLQPCVLDLAREVFAEQGPKAKLNDIARRAEVGPGTLYSHFPPRDTLIEAVFRNQVKHLIAAAERYSAILGALDALRAWMLKFIVYVADKLLILPALEVVPGARRV